jgi:hypothetical protein
MLTLVSYNNVRLLCNDQHWSEIVPKKRKDKPNDIPFFFFTSYHNIIVVSKSN